ncbi:hypothetical protein GGR53DRAFT_520690 [Hypoxylon sp. FL1150]|nr:hypothetical protein GGR53DRAFT_520690 [Hypoxylon sp. FL1150]
MVTDTPKKMVLAFLVTHFKLMSPEMEIQLSILERLIHDNGHSLAQLATVTRQWQYVIERHNFERIKLTLWRMPEFNSMTRRNRALVKSIWVSLELEKYDCPMCDGRLRDPRRCNHTAGSCTIIKAMHDLFWNLSAWDSSQPEKRLALDISIYSPSDSEHYFKYLTFGPDTPSHDQKLASSNQLDDHKHGWIAGKPHFAPPRKALEYVHREFLDKTSCIFWDEENEMRWWQSLPEAPVVSSILFRLQNRRRFTPTTLKCMFSRLPNLETIHYEPWRCWSLDDEAVTDQANCSLLESLTSYNGNLRKLVLFENFDEQYSLRSLGTSNIRTTNRSLGRAVARASLKLQHLSASFIIEADHFFHAAESEPAWHWPHLRSLTLTSRLFSAKGNRQSINQMLLEAASVASKMPKLETFEIWNGQVESAAHFRFQVSDRYKAVLSWKSNWEHAIPAHVAKAWEAVAHAHGKADSRFVAEFSVDDTIRINSHADAINYLKLFKVLRPVSLQQILAAHTARDKGLPQRLGLTRTPGHPNATSKRYIRSPISGNQWAKAMTYYRKVQEEYYTIPAHEDYILNKFNHMQRPE